MHSAAALGVGLCIVLLVLVAAAYAWYNYTGWTAFSFAGTVPYSFGAGTNCSGAASACVGGNCVATCQSDSDCGGAADSCTGGYCPPGSSPTACCSEGYALQGGQCYKACSSGAPCPSGYTCDSSGLCQSGSSPAWGAASGENVSALRFKSCKFSVIDPQGGTHTADVTAVLNGMAVAYRGATGQVPAVLRLDRPLNAFSFIIPGVNDSATVKTAADAKLWQNSPTALVGYTRTI
jgi:hypothetical protein